MNKEDLLKFTDEIKKTYEDGKIHSPIHLSGDNEEKLIKTFELLYTKGDWIFSTWRSSYHWLLSGRDPKELKKQILDGHSMHVFGDRFFTSAIVGGIAPIALGVAWGLKLNKSENKVLCFVGDGGYHCGITQECIRYASGFDLPIIYIIEDNGLTVQAKTNEIWGTNRIPKVKKYNYTRRFPHAGTGAYVMF